MLLYILLGALALAAWVLVVQMWELILSHRITQRALYEHLTSLAPKDYTILHELAGKENEPRTVIDQLGAVVADIDGRLERMEGILAYVRSLCWEVYDPRYKRDIMTPPKSVRWETTFGPHEDPQKYGLWTRERDISEEFDRDIVRPALQRTPGQPGRQGPGESPSDSTSEPG